MEETQEVVSAAEYPPGVDPAEFEPSASVSLADACERGLLTGRGGGPASLDLARRWADPAQGCRPAGAKRPALVLPAVKYHGQWRTMPEWCRAFELARVAAAAAAGR